VLAAVKKNGYALEYVKDQTPEICLEAVKQDGWSIRFVPQEHLQAIQSTLEVND
jgi:hypothetical protein